MRGIKLKAALNLIEYGLEEAEKQNSAPLTLVVLDNGGHIKASASQDNSGTARFDIAKGKAAAALGLGFGTRQFYNLVNKNVLPEMFATTINGATGGNFIPLPGGVLILEAGEVIGAIGISGASSDLDEFIAIKAIERLGLSASA